MELCNAYTHTYIENIMDIHGNIFSFTYKINFNLDLLQFKVKNIMPIELRHGNG